MLRSALASTFGVYRHLVGEIVIAVFTVLGGLVAKYYDVLRLATFLDPTLAYGIYALVCLVLTFPVTLIVMSIRVARKAQAEKRPRARLDISKLRLADGMFQEGIWQESQEHSLTVIN